MSQEAQRITKDKDKADMSDDGIARMEYFISLLDNYLDGNLDEGQNKEIENLLRENPSYKEVLIRHVQARANIRIAGETALRNKFINNFDSIPDEPKKQYDFLNIIILIVGLSSLVLLAYLYFSNQEGGDSEFYITANAEGSDKMMLENIEDPSYDLLRSNKDTVTIKKWQSAIQSFIIKDYSTVLSSLATLEDDSLFIKNHFGKYSLMKGVANLKLEQYDKAKQALILIDFKNPYYDQAEWYLALTFYYAGDREEATDLLQQVVNNESHYKRSRAKAYLDILME